MKRSDFATQTDFPQSPNGEVGKEMQAKEVKRGYQVKRHGIWNMVDMVLVTWVNAYPETERDETRRIILSCGCTITAAAEEEMEARNGS